MKRRAGRPTSEAATVVNVRIPVSLVERLDRDLDKVATETGLTTNRGALLRHALKVFLESKQM
jgi:metal-responsive CopG/Arc/MetJ family transcriptional regulator